MSWNRFKEFTLPVPALEMSLDISRMDFPADFFASKEADLQKAFAAMAALEKGAIANPDEERMVGHYWLRNPALAPSEDITRDIEAVVERMTSFASKVHAGELLGSGGSFNQLLIVGIGGSALGPQFVSEALADPVNPPLRAHFFDNTDPDGMARVLARLEGKLGQTLCVVISKSGGTPETRNGMLVAEEAYRQAGLDFGKHAVAITGENSKLDRYAAAGGWLARYPMWDWVGGRTSELGPVGLLPAALEGIDIAAMLEGAKTMDEVTRQAETKVNPAAWLALMWHFATNGKGEKDMVILPYKDRLMLFSKYLQQLVMESLGKEKDLDGNVVHQGLAVYGNKGSTDQHAYVQQLREGVPNFFATFIEVLADGGEPFEVEAGVTSGDYLKGFLLGTRRALHENGRQSITLTVPEVSPRIIGALIALYERAVGLYATLVHINAYHQPGVEAGKKAAGEVLEVVSKLQQLLQQHQGEAFTVEQVAQKLGLAGQEETLYKLLEHLTANPHKKVAKSPGAAFYDASYAYQG
ncbi:MAG: glucose-6-phosphate isomerase [Opitutales bacterium]